jgi:molybdate transport system regulatory protein
MLRKPKPDTVKRISPRLRVLCGDEIALGPGKADLLAVVAETGSIREAAERLHMSYMRAWTLIRTMNQCFKEPLVVSIRGGKAGGGAHLTDTGTKALELYQRMERNCFAAMNQDWAALKKFLRETSATNARPINQCR